MDISFDSGPNFQRKSNPLVNVPESCLVLRVFKEMFAIYRRRYKYINFSGFVLFLRHNFTFVFGIIKARHIVDCTTIITTIITRNLDAFIYFFDSFRTFASNTTFILLPF